MLKAFSVFKKRQQSNWKLLLTGPIDRKSKVLLESLKTYKYRDDTVLTGLLKDEDMVKLTGSAYAMICTVPWNRAGVSVLGAMACDIPVITSHYPLTDEIAGNAVLYADPEDPTDMAEKSYFAHTSPEGLTPWYWITLAGYRFSLAGENLAIDFTESEDVENAWMNSPAHRASIQPDALLTIPGERSDETGQPDSAGTLAATARARSGNENPAGGLGPGLGNPRSLGTAFVLNFQVLALLGE